MARKKIEIYGAGCRTCLEAELTVRHLAGRRHDIEVHDMHQPDVADQAARMGIRSVPAVVIDGQLASCCIGGGVDEEVLRSALA